MGRHQIQHNKYVCKIKTLFKFFFAISIRFHTLTNNQYYIHNTDSTTTGMFTNKDATLIT